MVKSEMKSFNSFNFLF